MTDRSKARLRIVVAAVADRIAAEFTADPPSTPYPNRRDTGVRVYLEVSPE
jgi:hypothetical protein